MASDNLSGAEILAGVRLYTRKITNKIGVTAWTAEHLGYLDKNKTQLQVRGTITRQDTKAMYAFMFRTGDQLRLALTENKGEEGCRIQIMDSNGRKVFADSAGKDQDLKDAYAKLLNGELDLKNGNYTLVVTHDTDKVSKNATLNYTIKLSSGTTYKERYRTEAAAQTLLQHYQENGTLGYSQATMAASFLTTQMNGDEYNLFDYLA